MQCLNLYPPLLHTLLASDEQVLMQTATAEVENLQKSDSFWIPLAKE